MKTKTIVLVLDVQQFVPAMNYKSRLDCLKNAVLPMCSRMMDDDRMVIYSAHISPLWGAGMATSAVSDYETIPMKYAKALREMVDVAIHGFDEDDEIHFILVTDRYEKERDFECSRAIKHAKSINVMQRSITFHLWSIGNEGFAMNDVDAKTFADAADLTPDLFVQAVFGANKVEHPQDTIPDLTPLPLSPSETPTEN